MSQGGRVWPHANDFDGVVNFGGCAVEGYATEVPLSQVFQHLPVAVLLGKVEAATKPKRKRALA